MVGLAPELPYSQEKIPRNPLERDLAGPSGGLDTGVEDIYIYPAGTRSFFVLVVASQECIE